MYLILALSAFVTMLFVYVILVLPFLMTITRFGAHGGERGED